MKRKHIMSLLTAGILSMAFINAPARQWSLKECLDYAQQNSYEIMRLRSIEQQAEVNVKQQKGGWLPTLSASASQSLSYTPFLKSQTATINGNSVNSSADKTSYNGNYGVNAAWTVYNGNQTANNIRLSKIEALQAGKQTEISLNQIKEEIVKLYIQILYTQEALNVNKELLKQDEILYERGKSVLEQGQIAKYQLVELQTQVANGQYDVVNTQTQIDQYKLQLKQLIYAPMDEDLDVMELSLSDQQALSAIPSAQEVYNKALSIRPEISNAELGVKQSELNYQIAKAGWLPTLSLSAGLGSNHSSGNYKEWFEQMKRNFYASIGFTLSIPIFDGHKTKYAVQKADIEKTIAKLDKMDAENNLYYTIANYRLNAYNNQQKYIAGQQRLNYNQQNYNAIFEKARIGTMDIVETLNARSSLLSAQQDALQSKYLTIYNKEMLNFYGDGSIEL